MSQKQYRYRIESIDVPLKALVTPPAELNITDADFNFNFTIDINVDAKKDLAFAITTIRIAPIKNQEAILAQLMTVVGFKFEEFSEIFELAENNKYNMPLEVEITLKTLGYSTTRGILYSELKGTFLQSALLPVINLQDIIIKDRAKIESEKKEL